MKIKESIYDAVSHMDANELILLYEQIRFLERVKNAPAEKKTAFFDRGNS
ncbi:MAG: hypothetical protein GY749_33830 [Desulfobacteraceae bacterium]|nr:hypothetical protein [Desulfobacteraceae bacterium]